MSDTTSAANAAQSAEAAPRRGFLSPLWLILLALVLLALAGGGGYYYQFVLRKAPPAQGGQAVQKEPPLPYYLEVKPFVVSMGGSGSETHFVQIGVNLTLPGAAAGNLINAMLPEVQDTLRLSALSFKVNDITSPAGVEKMRTRMVADLNRMLLQHLGAERIARVNGGDKELVKHLYFSQLIIE
jgi:flagellar protein FliL